MRQRSRGQKRAQSAGGEWREKGREPAEAEAVSLSHRTSWEKRSQAVLRRPGRARGQLEEAEKAADESQRYGGH